MPEGKEETLLKSLLNCFLSSKTLIKYVFEREVDGRKKYKVHHNNNLEWWELLFSKEIVALSIAPASHSQQLNKDALGAFVRCVICDKNQSIVEKRLTPHLAGSRCHDLISGEVAHLEHIIDLGVRAEHSPWGDAYSDSLPGERLKESDDVRVYYKDAIEFLMQLFLGAPYEILLKKYNWFADCISVNVNKPKSADYTSEQALSIIACALILCLNIEEDPKVNANIEEYIKSVVLNDGGSKYNVYYGELQTRMNSGRLQEIRGQRAKEVNITLDKVFKAAAEFNVIAVFDRTGRQLNATLTTDVLPAEEVAFLGLGEELPDQGSMNIERLLYENFCDSIDGLKFLLRRYSNALEKAWDRLKSNIKENFSRSLSASWYYDDVRDVPLRPADLKGYSVTQVRLDNFWKRICPAVKEIIQSTNAGIDFFAYCDVEVTQDRVIEYIVALVLACFGCCQTGSTDEELARLRKNYQSELRELIHQKFGFDPPGGRGSSVMDIDEVMKLTAELQTMIDGLKFFVSKISELRDQLILGYNDENSLLPPSKGREL